MKLLTLGNKKLGDSLIWVFNLPSRTDEVCVGASELCKKHCYMRWVEARSPLVKARYADNLAQSRRKDFALLINREIKRAEARVVRVHGGGDFYDLAYASKWLKVFQSNPQTRFYFYTRSWRLQEFSEVFSQMALLSNVRCWFSCDAETGLPVSKPSSVRIAWMQTVKETVSESSDLIFRTKALRSLPMIKLQEKLICPPENGTKKGKEIDCQSCKFCYKE